MTRASFKSKDAWPRGPYRWIVDRVLHVSVPFTWNLPDVRGQLMQRDLYWDHAIVGGPAVALMTGFFDGLAHVEVGGDLPGVMQMVNPRATKTSIGCTRRCEYCAVPRTEGKLQRNHSLAKASELNQNRAKPAH